MIPSTSLDANAHQWVIDQLGTDARMIRAWRLPGATSSTLYRLQMESGGDLVLRLFTKLDWLAEEPDLAYHEAAALQQAARVDVPTPELVAIDGTGDSCGVPAVLMTVVPGDITLQPLDQARWLHALAAALYRVHQISADDHGWAYFTYNHVTALTVPVWTRQPALWAKAIEIVNGPRPAAPECFIHRDYHMMNVLFENGSVSGIVDWVNACRGVPHLDLAHCRLNLSGLLGVAAADGFLAAYQRIAGPAFSYHPYWDLLGFIEDWPGPPGVYSGWVDFGVHHLTDALMHERSDAYLASIMARF